MNFTTQNGIAALNPLAVDVAKIIRSNQSLFKQLITKKSLKGLGRTQMQSQAKVLTMDEVNKTYNAGISMDEIYAWVWYKRSMGNPMKGWEKYFINQGEKTKLVVAIKEARIYDNSQVYNRSVGPKTSLGKFIKVQNRGDHGDFYVFRNDSGIELVDSREVELVETTNGSDQAFLNRLVKNGALFYLNGELIPYPIYTYGNIYEREMSLRDDEAYIKKTFGIKVYEGHVLALKTVKPKMLSIINPDKSQRPIISAISKFAESFFIKAVKDEYMQDVERAEELRRANGRVIKTERKKRIDINFDGVTQYDLQDVFSKWLYTLDELSDFNKSNAIDVVSYYIRNNPLRDDKLSADEKREIKANARNEGEELFAKFLHEVLTVEDQQRLDITWNRLYNGYSDFQYKRVPVGFAISTRFKQFELKISNAQREGVAFMQALGSGIVAYDVGVGKTMTAIVNIASELMQGKTKRPIIVVPKPTYRKWINEMVGYTDPKTNEHVYGVLSNTGITVNEWFNLGDAVLKKIDITKPVPEKSITIVTYEGWKRIGFSQNIISGILKSLIDILETNDSGDNGRSKAKKESNIESIIGIGNKETVLDIDSVGFDYVVIDEAHRCKNVFNKVDDTDEDSKHNTKRYRITGGQSTIGLKTFLLLNYLQRKYGKCSMLLTATPFTNSPLEIYSMISLVGYDYLLKNKVLNLKHFFDLFVQPTEEYVVNAKEEIILREVVKSFVNRPLLQKLIYNHITYKTGEEAGVKRPCKINLPRINVNENGRIKRLAPKDQTLTYLQMTPLQRENQNFITEMANSNEGADVLTALNASLNNALSPYLFNNQGIDLDYKTFVNDSPKIKYACLSIKSVKEWHKQRGEEASGQLIYMNRGKEFFGFVQDYLNKEVGYKSSVSYSYKDDNERNKTIKLNEVEIITSNVSETKKELIKDAFLDGVVKVIIATSTIREGIDLQKRGSVIYNLYPDWNPTDLKQLEGRIWRQGNLFGFVRVVMPLVSDSMDTFIFQKLEEKTGRINDLWDRADRGNVIDLEALDPQEVKLALITDVSRLVKVLFDEEVKELQKTEKRAKAAITAMEEAARTVKTYFEYREYTLEEIKGKENSVFNYVSNLKRYENADNNKEIKELESFLKTLQEFNSKSTVDDKEILSIIRQLEFRGSKYGGITYLSYRARTFKSYQVSAAKIDRLYLKPKKLNLNSDLVEALGLFRKDLENIQNQITKYNQDSEGNKLTYMEAKKSVRWAELLAEAIEKKSSLNIEGKTIEQRVEEFKKLNYLMAFPADYNQTDSCSLPSIKDAHEMPNFLFANAKKVKAKPVNDKGLEYELLLLEAELELIALESNFNFN